MGDAIKVCCHRNNFLHTCAEIYICDSDAKKTQASTTLPPYVSPSYCNTPPRLLLPCDLLPRKVSSFPYYPDLSISMTDEKYSSYYYLRYHNITHITSHLTTAAMPKEDFYLSPYQRLMKRISPTSAPEKLAEKAGKEQIQQPRRVSTISRLLKISGR